MTRASRGGGGEISFANEPVRKLRTAQLAMGDQRWGHLKCRSAEAEGRGTHTSSRESMCD